MITCPNCKTSNLDMSRFCDECGVRLASTEAPAYEPPAPTYTPPPTADVVQRPVSVTSIGVPPIEVEASMSEVASNSSPDVVGVAHAMMVIERGDGPGTEFKLINNESIIGRWDADNGVFPDVDLMPSTTTLKFRDVMRGFRAVTAHILLKTSARRTALTSIVAAGSCPEIRRYCQTATR